MGRTPADNLAILDQHKVGFIAATQPIDTYTSTGKLILGALAAVEFEPAFIVERTLEGLSRARPTALSWGDPRAPKIRGGGTAGILLGTRVRGCGDRC